MGKQEGEAATAYRRVRIHPTARLSPLASIVGDVEVGRDVCVLAGAQIRGDDGGSVSIGAEANLQENVVVHVGAGASTTIGRHATIGHGAIVHGCDIGDNALIGMGAIILDGARIGENAVVGAGSLVTQGKEVPAGHMAFGSPARVIRALDADEIDRLCTRGADGYLATSERMVAEGVLAHPAAGCDLWP